MPFERLKYSPEGRLAEAGVDKVGVVVLVVNSEGMVWVNREINKPAVAGMIAPPCETRRQGEFIRENVIGALVEEMGVDLDDQSFFLWIDGSSYAGRYLFSENGKTVHADLVFLKYSGNGQSFIPRNEVESVGWMVSDELARDKRLRTGVGLIMENVVENGLVRKFLAASGKERIVLDGIDPDLFYQQRSQNGDIRNG